MQGSNRPASEQDLHKVAGCGCTSQPVPFMPRRPSHIQHHSGLYWCILRQHAVWTQVLQGVQDGQLNWALRCAALWLRQGRPTSALCDKPCLPWHLVVTSAPLTTASIINQHCVLVLRPSMARWWTCCRGHTNNPPSNHHSHPLLIMLEYGTNVNAQGGRYGSALQAGFTQW
jgi:hypothetical protein